MRQALALVKRELGDEAVILDTRAVRQNRFLGFKSREQVEVTAAVDCDRATGPEAAASPDETLERLRALHDEVRQLKGLVKPESLAEEPAALKMLRENGVSRELLKISDDELRLIQDKNELTDLVAGALAGFTAPAAVEDHSVIALVGPTGVGKTTTLAKLAARYGLQQGKSVALITCDTFRIGGVEQIKVYARILDVPLEIVTSPSEMTAAVEKHSGRDVVLIDTIGRSQKNALQLGELRTLLAPAEPTQTCLVVSACLSASVHSDVVECFSALAPNRLIVSKVDEAHDLGCLVNLPLAARLPVTCITDGQDVPDDLKIAEPRMLAELALGTGG